MNKATRIITDLLVGMVITYLFGIYVALLILLGIAFGSWMTFNQLEEYKLRREKNVNI